DPPSAPRKVCPLRAREGARMAGPMSCPRSANRVQEARAEMTLLVTARPVKLGACLCARASSPVVTFASASGWCAHTGPRPRRGKETIMVGLTDDEWLEVSRQVLKRAREADRAAKEAVTGLKPPAPPRSKGERRADLDLP